VDAGETKAVAVPVGTLTHEYHPVGGKKVKKTHPLKSWPF